jgi:hypothetical protein
MAALSPAAAHVAAGVARCIGSRWDLLRRAAVWSCTCGSTGVAGRRRSMCGPACARSNPLGVRVHRQVFEEKTQRSGDAGRSRRR